MPSGVNGLTINEWYTGVVERLWDEAKTTSLGLAIEETPQVTWPDPSQWVNVYDYGARCGTEVVPN